MIYRQRSCTNIAQTAFWSWFGAMDFITDLSVLALPIYLLHDLQIPLQKRINALTAFCLRVLLVFSYPGIQRMSSNPPQHSTSHRHSPLLHNQSGQLARPAVRRLRNRRVHLSPHRHQPPRNLHPVHETDSRRTAKWDICQQDRCGAHWHWLARLCPWRFQARLERSWIAAQRHHAEAFGKPETKAEKGTEHWF